MELVRATRLLYHRALIRAVASFVRCWMIAVAVVIFAAVMLVAVMVAGGLGLLGGFLIGAANAVLVGATLGLVQDAVLDARRVGLEDIWRSFGRYFWDVIGVLFVLWVPMMVLERGLALSPYGPALTSVVFLLLFIILNPAPEIIYQVRLGNTLEIIRESYEFVVENWIEWFLPLVVLALPLLVSFYFNPSGSVNWAGGLSFADVLFFPGTALDSWLAYLGIPPDLRLLLVLVVTPPLAVFLLLFRGHLFASLHGSSRRQRLFQTRGQSED